MLMDISLIISYWWTEKWLLPENFHKKHNPIEQEIRFEPVRGQNLVFKATRIVDNAKRVWDC